MAITHRTSEEFMTHLFLALAATGASMTALCFLGLIRIAGICSQNEDMEQSAAAQPSSSSSTPISRESLTLAFSTAA